jgi:hypothetical protein
MKSFKLFLEVVIALVLIFFFYNTLTLDKRCGWKDSLGKDWPCSCLGIVKTTIDGNLTDPLNVVKETYYCTGLNLSCSKFTLNLFYNNNLQKPISCR